MTLIAHQGPQQPRAMGEDSGHAANANLGPADYFLAVERVSQRK